MQWSRYMSENANEEIPIGTYLAVTGSESHPGGAGPPGDDEPKEPGVLWTSAFGRPNVDRTAERKSGANLSEDAGYDHHTDNSDDIGRPEEAVKSMHKLVWMRQYVPNGSGAASEKTEEEPRSSGFKLTTEKQASGERGVPNTSDEIESTEASGKAFDEMPRAVKLLEAIKSDSNPRNA